MISPSSLPARSRLAPLPLLRGRVGGDSLQDIAMPDPVMFEFGNFPVRVQMIDHAPWFSGSDVAAALGYARPADAIRAHCKGSVECRPLETAGGPQTVRFISEPDVFRLIVGSKLPSAQRFEQWVFADVLPAIRRTGKFGAPAVDLTDPHQLRTALLHYSERAIEQEKTIAEQKPLVAALERISAGSGDINITSAAKIVGLAPRKLFARLHMTGWIYKRTATGPWCAHQDKVRSGCLVEKLYEHGTDDEGHPKMRAQVLITPKGITAISRSLERSTPAAERSIAAAAALLQE